jgi:hypothetical protein
MKAHKKSNRDRRDFYDDEEDDYRPSKKKDSPKRRPVKNWTKVWEEHQSDWDEMDEFYTK